MADRKFVLVTIAKVLSIFTLLYLFICSLDLLSAAFRLLSVYGLGEFNIFEDWQSNALLQVNNIKYF